MVNNFLVTCKLQLRVSFILFFEKIIVRVSMNFKFSIFKYVKSNSLGIEIDLQLKPRSDTKLLKYLLKHLLNTSKELKLTSNFFWFQNSVSWVIWVNFELCIFWLLMIHSLPVKFFFLLWVPILLDPVNHY